MRGEPGSSVDYFLIMLISDVLLTDWVWTVSLLYYVTVNSLGISEFQTIIELLSA